MDLGMISIWDTRSVNLITGYTLSPVMLAWGGLLACRAHFPILTEFGSVCPSLLCCVPLLRVQIDAILIAIVLPIAAVRCLTEVPKYAPVRLRSMWLVDVCSVGTTCYVFGRTVDAGT